VKRTCIVCLACLDTGGSEFAQQLQRQGIITKIYIYIQVMIFLSRASRNVAFNVCCRKSWKVVVTLNDKMQSHHTILCPCFALALLLLLNEITSRGAFLEKVVVTQLIKIQSAIYAMPIFITVFTWARNVRHFSESDEFTTLKMERLSSSETL
jgi:hypothetical protein